MIRISLLLLFILSGGYTSICSIVPVFAEELKVLTVEEPPSSFLNKKGEPEGFSVDIVREIQRRVNNHDPIQFVSEIRALQTASKYPDVVLFSFTRTKDREDVFHWIMLLMRKPWVMYAKKGAHFDIKKLEDAAKIKRVGVVRGDVRATHLERLGFTNLEMVATHEQNVKKLLINRIQVLFYEPQGMSFVCRKLGIRMSEFEPVLETEPSEVYIMMSKQGTKPETVRKWRDAARRIKEDGTFQSIAEKWAKNIYEQNRIVCEVKNGALNF
jgi:polar amino acid transport system substrate-binding protein